MLRHTTFFPSISCIILNFLQSPWKSRHFLFIIQEVLYIMFYITFQNGTKLFLGNTKSFGPQECCLFFSRQIRDYCFPNPRYKIFLSDIRHDNKQCLFGEDIRSINTTWRRGCKRELTANSLFWKMFLILDHLNSCWKFYSVKSKVKNRTTRIFGFTLRQISKPREAMKLFVKR